jgi:hypothetical protein
MKTGMSHEAIGNSKAVNVFCVALCALLLAFSCPATARITILGGSISA